MSRLTEKGHWDDVHQGEQERLFDASARSKILGAVKRVLGPAVLQRMSGYDDYLLWDVILPHHVLKMNGGSVVEIGSAPGEYVSEFGRRHGCVPHGIEYSEIGVEVNRQVFSKHGFDPDNVIHADVFSEEFAQRFREKFDVVLSKGFIEHFEDLKPVIDRHMTLLKPAGYLVVTVPNLRGANNALARMFDETAIPRHNVKIMRRNVYRELFKRADLQELFCDYYGTFSFYLFTSGKSPIRRCVLKVGSKMQPLLNLAFRTAFGEKGAETSWFSPFLIYIGKKLPVNPATGH